MKIYNHKLKLEDNKLRVIITADHSTTYKALQGYATKQAKGMRGIKDWENIFSYGREGKRDKKLNDDTYEFTYLFERSTV